MLIFAALLVVMRVQTTPSLHPPVERYEQTTPRDTDSRPRTRRLPEVADNCARPHQACIGKSSVTLGMLENCRY